MELQLSRANLLQKILSVTETLNICGKMCLQHDNTDSQYSTAVVDLYSSVPSSPASLNMKATKQMSSRSTPSIPSTKCSRERTVLALIRVVHYEFLCDFFVLY